VFSSRLPPRGALPAYKGLPEGLLSHRPGRSLLGKLRPDFALPDLFDEPLLYRLSDYRGRPVILNFWASWCLPCRREMPALQTTATRYEADGLLLLGMNQTYIDDLEAARTFVKELGLIFPNTRDDSGSVGADAYQVIGIPTSVFINAAGEVVQIQIGEMSLEQLAAYSERLIAGEPLLP
jgi:cytochrome c biogenesis protein CcmG, thiol:disulfide interchange protein DsbE